MEKAVEALNLVKKFGNIIALNGTYFEVKDGEVFGLIGPNGAGKTTALRIISTLIKPTKGTARIFNYDVVDDPEEVREIISYLPEEAGAYQNLSGYEYLRFMAGFYADNSESIDEILAEGDKISGLGTRLDDRVKNYSQGMKRRLLLGRALMMKPKLAILDEPTSGLDVIHAYHVRQIIKDYADKRGVTVLLSSHNMLEVEFLCHRVALLNEGFVITEGKPEVLKEKFNAENLEQVFMEATKLG